MNGRQECPLPLFDIWIELFRTDEFLWIRTFRQTLQGSILHFFAQVALLCHLLDDLRPIGVRFTQLMTDPVRCMASGTTGPNGLVANRISSLVARRIINLLTYTQGRKTEQTRKQQD